MWTDPNEGLKQYTGGVTDDVLLGYQMNLVLVETITALM